MGATGFGGSLKQGLTTVVKQLSLQHSSMKEYSSRHTVEKTAMTLTRCTRGSCLVAPVVYPCIRRCVLQYTGIEGEVQSLMLHRCVVECSVVASLGYQRLRWISHTGSDDGGQAAFPSTQLDERVQPKTHCGENHSGANSLHLGLVFGGSCSTSLHPSMCPAVHKHWG